ncbi:hypothetical protein [Paractinoplanes globisporus]|uniref:Secreted protein n=1 Tax=Paractinoplanes globisporus TaxID=113565 RepID=A0ABW6W9H3_9ACTN|nr:hypothetical protein [Actinoplanes globisporus]
MTLPSTLDRPIGGGRARRRPAREPENTPLRLRRLTTAAAALTVVLGVLLTVQLVRADHATSRLAVGEAPVVEAASDLYFALNDMDAQLANALLVGDATDLGITRVQAQAIFDRRRQQAYADLEELAASGVRIRDLLDGLGRYEALAAQAELLKRPEAYRLATTLLRRTLLGQAQDIVDGQRGKLTDGYRAESRAATLTRTAVAGVAVVLIAVLVALQIFLGRRFRRTVNPGAAAATAVLVGLAAGSLVLLDLHANRLHTQKQDAFDSIVALTRARAISYDANADESRYLLDPAHAAEYETGFLGKTQQILQLPGATLATYDQRLDTAWASYRHDHGQVGWGGAMGTEFGNITFAGERAAAERTVQLFEAYQEDDRRIRQLASSGQRDAAVRLCTSYAPGGSNYAFDRYDAALAAVIAVNTHAFDSVVHADRRDLGRSVWVPGVATLIALALLLAGVRPRLAEYH